MTTRAICSCVDDQDTGGQDPTTDDHAAAAAAFVERARTAFGSLISDLYVFGSTARGDTRGLASDVDVLVVLDEDANTDAVADRLRDHAYDVMLEYGPVVELHLLSRREFEQSRRQGNPFVENAVREGRSYG